MDIERLYNDYNVDFLTEGHKHCRPNWVNSPCPFCSGENYGYHLGFSLVSNSFTCWRCGWHPVSLTLSKLMKLPEGEARKIVKGYGILLSSQQRQIVEVPQMPHMFPSHAEPLLWRHKMYLEQREYDPEKLEKEWNLMSSGTVSTLDGINYKHRILIPYIWNYQQVSFDARDITGKHPNKYQACPAAREALPHKNILYGNQELWGKNGICVEGTTDVWRLGGKAFATSGIKFTIPQVREIAKNFKRVFIIFDSEIQAVQQALKLARQLKFHGVKAVIVKIDNDPGSMKQDDADHLVKTLMK